MSSSRCQAGSSISNCNHFPTTSIVDNNAHNDTDLNVRGNLADLDNGLSDAEYDPDSHTGDSDMEDGLSNDGLSVRGFMPGNRPANLNQVDRHEHANVRKRSPVCAPCGRATSPSPIDQIHELQDTLRFKETVTMELEHALDLMVEESVEHEKEIRTLRGREFDQVVREADMLAMEDYARMMGSNRGHGDGW